MNRISIESRKKIVENILKESETGNIFLKIGNRNRLEISHFLAVKYLIEMEKNDIRPLVLWLDSGNSFNPHKISKIAERKGHVPENILEDIYISRAFTCYQAMSAIHEKIPRLLDKRKVKLIILTDLPRIFVKSDLSKENILRAFRNIYEKLEDLKKRKKTIFLSTGNMKETEKIRKYFLSETDEILDLRRDRTGYNEKSEKFCLKIPKRKNKSQKKTKTKTLYQYGD